MELLESMTQEQNNIISTIHYILWHSRSITREEAWALSSRERDLLLSDIKKRIDNSNNTGMNLL